MKFSMEDFKFIVDSALSRQAFFLYYLSGRSITDSCKNIVVSFFLLFQLTVLIHNQGTSRFVELIRRDWETTFIDYIRKNKSLIYIKCNRCILYE